MRIANENGLTQWTLKGEPCQWLMLRFRQNVEPRLSARDSTGLGPLHGDPDYGA